MDEPEKKPESQSRLKSKEDDELIDPACNPNNPRRVYFSEIAAASYRIQNGVLKTPCVPSHMSEKVGMELYLKCEFLQYTGSFKERGARNALLRLTEEQKTRGVTAASLGNHSQGIAYHGKLLNIPTTLVMPGVAPLVKVEKCRSFGAEVIIHGNNVREARHHALHISKQKKMTYINGYDHPDVIAGQGTVGLEILEQVPDVDAIIVPVGGGGLIAGIAIAVKHFKPKILVYGVETEQSASMSHSLAVGEVTPYEITRTLADGLAVGVVGVNAFFNIKPLIDKMVVVTEDWAARAILHIVEQEKYVVEGGGAVAIAAVWAGHVPELEGKKVVCILSGGNIDTTVLSACLERGLVAEQRLIKFKVNISCSPGSLTELCTLIASKGISIKDVVQERGWLKGNIFSVQVKIICETRGPDHVVELRELISSKYKECFFLKEHTDGLHSSCTDSMENFNASRPKKVHKDIHSGTE